MITNITSEWIEAGLRQVSDTGERHLPGGCSHEGVAGKGVHNTYIRTKWSYSKCKRNCVPYHRSVLET